MCFLRTTLTSVFVVGWALLAFCGDGVAQVRGDSRETAGSSDTDGRQQRVLRPSRAGQIPAARTSSDPRTASRWSSRWSSRRSSDPTLRLAAADEPVSPADPPSEDVPLAPPTSMHGYYTAGERPGDCSSCPDCDQSYGCESYECQQCHDGYYGAAAWFHRWRWPWWTRNFSLFTGVHGFKGPLDQGRNGNFGFHEGLNFGAPLGGPGGLGYQLGVQFTQSNFSGDNVVHARRDDRDQVFFTGGIFRRAVCGGLQGGIAVDTLHDRYHEKFDLNQLRAEISYVGLGGREIGFWGAFGTKNDETIEEQGTTLLEPTDLYAFFYRRRFSSGGEGRLWGGFTGNSDGLIGGDIRIPIGRSWALQNTFNYLIPKEGRGVEGICEESWSVGLQLVWYPGRPARSIHHNPFHPLFNVADNSVFMVDLR